MYNFCQNADCAWYESEKGCSPAIVCVCTCKETDSHDPANCPSFLKYNEPGAMLSLARRFTSLAWANLSFLNKQSGIRDLRDATQRALK